MESACTGESSLQGTGRWGKARREEVWELVLNTFYRCRHSRQGHTLGLLIEQGYREGLQEFRRAKATTAPTWCHLVTRGPEHLNVNTSPLVGSG